MEINKIISVVVADGSAAEAYKLSLSVKRAPDLYLQATVRSGSETIRAAKILHPHVLVTDAVLPDMDGMRMLRLLREHRCMPVTILTAAFESKNLASEANSLGVDAFFLKPYQSDELIRSIRQCYHWNKSFRNSSARLRAARPERYIPKIRDALNKFGMPANLQGYRFSREAIIRNIEDPSSLENITKVLYPELARRFSTTPECVEGSIRNAVTRAWSRRDMDAERKLYFGSYVSSLNHRPSNTEFIALMTEFVLRNPP